MTGKGFVGELPACEGGAKVSGSFEGGEGRPFLSLELIVMALSFKSGTALSVKVSKAITRDSALKTLERLFMKDKVVSGPIKERSSNFIPLPKRRGGRIWTKRPNKIFPLIEVGTTATLKASPQVLRDLASVSTFVEVSKK